MVFRSFLLPPTVGVWLVALTSN